MPGQETQGFVIQEYAKGGRNEELRGSARPYKVDQSAVWLHLRKNRLLALDVLVVGHNCEDGKECQNHDACYSAGHSLGVLHDGPPLPLESPSYAKAGLCSEPKPGYGSCRWFWWFARNLIIRAEK